MEPATLTTERLELSVPRASDVDEIYAACQDPDTQRYTTVPSPYERHHAEEFVPRVAAQWEEGVHLTWAMREGGSLAGMIGLYRRDGAGAAELGYWVSPWARRRGLVAEASHAVLDWGFDPQGGDLRRIEWRAVTGNLASGRAARAVGFRYEGTLRGGIAGKAGREDCWIAGILRTDDRTVHPWPVLTA